MHRNGQAAGEVVEIRNCFFSPLVCPRRDHQIYLYQNRRGFATEKMLLGTEDTLGFRVKLSLNYGIIWGEKENPAAALALILSSKT
jgi:hypothetical protein